MKKILCVCPSNIRLSPMIAALLQERLGNEYRVESAGTNRRTDGEEADEDSVLVMRERGIDLSRHISRWIGYLDLSEYSAIVCTEAHIARDVMKHLNEQCIGTSVLIPNQSNGGIPSPLEVGPGVYRECLALLGKTLPLIADYIRS